MGRKLSEKNIGEEEIILKQRIEKTFADLFPFNRSLTGSGVTKTFDYIKENFLPESEIKSIASGSKVFDWQVPDEWGISDAFVINANVEKIIDFNESNLHVLAYSSAINKVVEKDQLLLGVKLH